MPRDEWIRLPSPWILNGGLISLPWKGEGIGANHAAALIAYTAIAHQVDRASGVGRITYDEICDITGLSRAKLAEGLRVITKDLSIVESLGRSTYKLANYNPAEGWAKLPARSMYKDGRIAAFHDCHLRSPAELEALKLFYLFIARRDRATNVASISYDKITDFAGVPRQRIKPAISWLINHSLLNVENVRSMDDPKNWMNVYRVVGIEPYNHRGTRGRMDEIDIIPPPEKITAPIDEFDAPF